jgi:hypothetical protein
MLFVGTARQSPYGAGVPGWLAAYWMVSDAVSSGSACIIDGGE